MKFHATTAVAAAALLLAACAQTPTAGAGATAVAEMKPTAGNAVSAPCASSSRAAR